MNSFFKLFYISLLFTKLLSVCECKSASGGRMKSPNRINTNKNNNNNNNNMNMNMNNNNNKNPNFAQDEIDMNFGFYDSASSSSTSSTNLKLPVKLSTNSERIYTSPSSNPLYSKNNDTISTSMINNYQHPQTNSCHNQSQSNCSYLYQPDASNPYYYSAYDQFLANTHLSQIYSRNLIENLNYGIINENISAPFLFGNQFNYKNNAQTVPNYPYVNTYFHSQEYGV